MTMEVLKCVLVIITVFCACGADVAPATKATQSCQPDKLTVYRVILHTFWTRDKFPKHYPDWRPSAQWSKLVGRSHDPSYELFTLGKKSSPGLKDFAETGRTDILERQSQGENGVLDEFSASPIPVGAGRTEAEFFVDGNHSRVSIMSKIVPSPDWFIGIDSFDLCIDGNWIDSITVEADPLDAGTDNGFTFTAPNWPTDPPGIIYKITSRYPSHPANSFYYPYVKKLPAIGTFQFIKIKEYELSEVFHHSQDKDHFEVMKIDRLTGNQIPETVRNNDIQQQIEEERKEEEVRSKTTTTTTTTDVSSSAVPAPRDAVERGDKKAIYNNIVQIYKKDQDKHSNPKKKTSRKLKSPRNCRVSEWGEWGACSKSCGIGEMQRRREVMKHARRGGKVCPPLLETKWCGSARACPKNYFNW